MRACRLLSGENIAPSTSAHASALIGKRVSYLRKCDIDRSGRGYFFPQCDDIQAVFRRQIIWASGDSVSFSDIVEMVEVKQ